MAICVLIGIGYFYLNNTVNNPANTETPKVPYYPESPQNIVAAFSLENEKTLICFDFKNLTTTVIFADGLEDDEIYGYKITNKIELNYEVIGGIVDILGGADLEINGEILNFTGNQVAHLFKTTTDRLPLRRNLITQIFKKIAHLGFTLEDMLYIIEHSKTDLTVPFCYSFIDYLQSAAKTVNFVN